MVEFNKDFSDFSDYCNRGIKTCPLCSTNENVIKFDTAEQRWIHHAETHTAFVKGLIDDDINDVEILIKYNQMKIIREIKPRVEFFEENFSSEFPQNKILLTKIKEALDK